MPESLDERLSQIVTRWTVLRQAQDGLALEARAAQERLLETYAGAIRRYLLACVRSPDLADELFQEFSMRLVQGGLRGACPEKGHFRHYIKGVLFHLLADYRQRQKRQPLDWNSQLPEPSDSQASLGADEEAQFAASWRAELLALAWKLLETEESPRGQGYFSILTYRRDHPEERSETMATQLSQRWGKTVTAAAIRQMLHRARERFADLLLEQILQSLSQPSVESLQEELMDLQLLHYCLPAVQRLQRESDSSL